MTPGSDARTPPVTVVIPAHNRAALVARAVHSALRQRPAPPAEVLVVDDGSSDGTAAAAAAAGACVIVHEANRGSSAARNTAIAHATQPWIALLDSDDEWMPDMLSTLWPLRAGHVIVGGGSLNVVGENGRSRYNGPLGRGPLVIRSPAQLIYPENFLATSGTLVRRDVMRDVGGFVEGQRGAEDLDLWLRILERGTALVVARPVVVYRIHEGQVTADGDMMRASHRETALRYADRDWWRPRRLMMWEGTLDYDALRASLRAGDRAGAVTAARSILGSPLHAAGAAGIVARRLRLLRRSGLIDERGEPTATYLHGIAPIASALIRPPSHARVSSRWSAAILRVAGVPRVSVVERSAGGPPTL